ncbi:helix-turn-helix transcriptional regulator [Gibbsiella quercinecans]|uniref:helix-turn-helix transcriptional regulator n=1 Tax=Gibbsiella quercinecans TaxID=929813 RepID=UPI001600456B|nr:LuxR C-terminal-related transcriptional regulator [Gibbsiella quercinecans]
MCVIYVDQSPLCWYGIRSLLPIKVFSLPFPSVNQLSSLGLLPELVIMDFPKKIYLFHEYILFLNYLRCCNPNLKTLFFIDNATPLVLSLIARTAPDALLHKGEKLLTVRAACLGLLQQKKPAGGGRLRGMPKPAAITRSEVLVLCETSRCASVATVARRLNLSPKTVYAHLASAARKFGLSNRVELLKMMASCR